MEERERNGDMKNACSGQSQDPQTPSVPREIAPVKTALALGVCSF